MADTTNKPVIAEQEIAVPGKPAKKRPPKIFADGDMDAIEVLEYDEKGAELVFDGDNLPVMSDEQYKRLSRANRLAYSLARQQHEKGKGDAIEGVEAVGPKFGKELDRVQLRDTEEMHYYWSRPDKVKERIANGWHICAPGETDTFDGKAQIKQLGSSELVLMGVPQKRWSEIRVERDRVTKRRLMAAAGGSVDGQSANGLIQVDDFEVKPS